MEGLPMKRTIVAAVVAGGTVLTAGPLLLGPHVTAGQDAAFLRSAAETPRGLAGPAPGAGRAPEPGDFRGAAATAGDWLLYVTDVRVEEDGVVTDGTGNGAHAPEGMVYHVFTLQAVNRGTEPLRFAPVGSTAADVDGRTFAHDPRAGRVASGSPAPLLAPGSVTETEVVFPAPPDARLYEIVVTIEYGAVFATLEARR